MSELALEAARCFGVQNQLGALVQKLGLTPIPNGVDYEANHGSLDARFRTARVNDAYRAVIFEIDTSQVPSLSGEATDDDELAKQRQALFVAASRARDRLHISWSGHPTPLLDEAIASL